MAIIEHILNPNPTSLTPDELSAKSHDFWEFLSSSYLKKGGGVVVQDGNDTCLTLHDLTFNCAPELSSGLASGRFSPR